MIALLSVNKPAGIITFASRHHPLGMRDIISKAFDIPNLQPISRLDIVTSGCLVFTKKRKDRDFYQRQFREKKVSKSYLAFVEGDFPEEIRGSIFSLSKSHLVLRDGKKKIVVYNPQNIGNQIVDIEEVKSTYTGYKVLRKYKNDQGKIFSLLEVTLYTGATHQIRAHLSQIGHPIVGDRLYNSNYELSQPQKILLHCYNLGLFVRQNEDDDYDTRKLFTANPQIHKHWQEFKENLQLIRN